MGRRSQHAGERSPAGAAAAAARTTLDGWPPTHYCYACHVRSHSAQDIREGYCEVCLRFLDRLERAYELSAAALPAAKTLPKA